MKNLFVGLIILICINGCVPIAQQSTSGEGSKTLRFEDFIYESNIKSVTLYPYSGKQRDLLESVAIPLSQQVPLQLSFDDLTTESQNYYVKVINCNANWTESFLPQIDYADAFNELLITNYTLSNATKVPYIHYTATIPQVRLSGNYLIKVYRDRNEDDLIITRRFMVYSDQLKIDAKVGFSNVVQHRNHNQQIDFSISYGNMELVNPLQNVTVMIRQNQRWDNAIYNLKPLFVREAEKLLEYNYFNLENNFRGGNEFRAFDIRSINFKGLNVGRITNTPAMKEVFLMIDKSRNNLPYSLVPDINGKFIVDNYDFQTDSTSGSDYLNVHFSLESPKLDKDVFVFGELSGWKLDPAYRLTYNQERQRYENSVLLKQGWYNYAYGVADNNGRVNTELFEGSRFETQNEYEIFVYYRPVGGRTDQLLGYYSVNYNYRR